MKPAGFMTNSRKLAQHLQRYWRRVQQTRRREAPRLKRKTCSWGSDVPLRDQLREDAVLKHGYCSVQKRDEDAEFEANIRGPEHGYSGKYRGHLTDQILNDSRILAAVAKELELFYSKDVRLKVPKEQAKATTSRPAISARWVGVNKGDDFHPNYRSLSLEGRSRHMTNRERATSPPPHRWKHCVPFSVWP